MEVEVAPTVTNRSGDKGARGEREAAALLSELTGYPVRRRLGAGRKDDVGDLDGLPDTVVQVAWWADILAAIRTKVASCVVQQENDKAAFGMCLIKMRARWIVVMTPEQAADLWKAANARET